MAESYPNVSEIYGKLFENHVQICSTSDDYYVINYKFIETQ